MIKLEIAQKAIEFGDCDYAKEQHEIEQLKITLTKTLDRLEEYLPDVNTYAGCLVDDNWTSLTNLVTEMLNYVDHSNERNTDIEEHVSRLEIESEWDAEHIATESLRVRS